MRSIPLRALTRSSASGRGSRRRPRHGTTLGLEVHAGHGLSFDTVQPVARLPEIVELNIGHFLIGEAIFVGLAEAVRTMRDLMDEARAAAVARMIIGIGSDTIDIRRVEQVLERHGERFTQRIFTDIEIRKSERRHLRAASYAKRFAAKEACSKALGTGMRGGVFWRDMGVVNLPSGKPTIRVDRRRRGPSSGPVAGRPQGRDPRHDHR